MKKIEIKYQIPGFAIILLIGFLFFKFGYPYFQNARLKHEIDNIVTYDKDRIDRNPDEWNILEKIYYEAERLDIPLKKDHIKVQIYDRDIKVDISYHYPVDLYFTKVTLKFHSRHRSKP